MWVTWWTSWRKFVHKIRISYGQQFVKSSSVLSKQFLVPGLCIITYSCVGFLSTARPCQFYNNILHNHSLLRPEQFVLSRLGCYLGVCPSAAHLERGLQVWVTTGGISCQQKVLLFPFIRAFPRNAFIQSWCNYFKDFCNDSIMTESVCEGSPRKHFYYRQRANVEIVRWAITCHNAPLLPR